ncbi:MAG: PHP domain-containing protein [Thermoanaerobacterales bacterium]|nr:PHP domain-containing protein [Bacillota bacterium]MDI6907166.1 PHP domain-containing protein [Thermoanaerobacterales bacterium]
MLADLHVHTTASDGSESPAGVVRRALVLGLGAIAITDHDTVAGLQEAREAAAGSPLVVVPGVEINTDYSGREVHVLGYYPRLEPQFIALLKDRAEARVRRVIRMVEKLNALGIAIRVSDVMARAGQGSVGRPHVAAALVAAGAVADMREAFDRFIGRGGPAYVPRARLHPAEAVQSIARVGGVPVLAHPGTIGDDRILPELLAAGLAGVEAYHPEHDEDRTKHYLALAERYGLVVTGGSDFHGEGYHAALGEVSVPYAAVQALRRLRRV